MVYSSWYSRQLPYDVIHGTIIPLVLADHLHKFFVVKRQQPSWHPFHTLPLVSKDFYASCKTLSRHIFGLGKGDGSEDIVKYLKYTCDFWENAHRHPAEAHRPNRLGYGDGPTLSALESEPSLVRIYLCTALATIFFKTDIMRPIVLEQRYLNKEQVSTAEWDVPYIMMNGADTRAYKMKDSQLHTCFRPILAALRLCDRVPGPRCLFYYIAEHLTKILTEYVSTALLLKASQDLEMDMVDGYADLKYRRDWANVTLNVSQNVEEAIGDMLRSTKLVRSFYPYTDGDIRIPPKVLDDTKIIEVLNQVALTDWGDPAATANINERALNAVEDLERMAYPNSEEDLEGDDQGEL